MRGSRVAAGRGFTLVELLVVVTIIAVLCALLLPAVQAAREAARQVQCRNNLKQLALGCLNHEQVTGRFPTGGWGSCWTGDPDMGTARSQPGGWIYNVLPYIEKQNIHDLGASQPTVARNAANLSRLSIPMGIVCCPSRRPPILHAWAGANVVNAGTPVSVARTDYAANGGDLCSNDDCNAFTVPGFSSQPSWACVLSDDWDSGPASYADGGIAPCTSAQLVNARYSFNIAAQFNNGIVFRGSLVKMSDVKDGTSVTYLAGEKGVGANYYLTGTMDGDDLTTFIGFDDDNTRWGADRTASGTIMYIPPLLDPVGYPSQFGFGSAHENGLMMAFCDGSVKLMSYSLDPETHRRLCNRSDGLTVDGKQF